jgi:hypothetical protein
MARRSGRRDILRRLDAAREGLFPYKTCPASRHVHIIVEGLLGVDGTLAKDLHGYDPEHMAGSIASVLEDLWKARRWMRWQPNVEGDYMKGGEWVPDLDAIAQWDGARRAETACPARGPKPRQARSAKADAPQ